MEKLTTLQSNVQTARTEYKKADDAYYQALQQGGNSPAEITQLETLRSQRQTAQNHLAGAIASLTLAGDPQQLVGQVSADLPFLLLPVRLEARYLTVRHAVRNLSPSDVVDAGKVASASNQMRTIGFETREEGVETYQVSALHLNSFSGWGPAENDLKRAALLVKSGQFIRRKADRNELWVRIYPDEVFTEAFERHLQAPEVESGQAFWQKIWAAQDPETAWLALADTAGSPRAAWILQATRPINFQNGVPQGDTPQFPVVLRKDGPYTRPPVARLLPERMVVCLEKNGVTKEFIGKPIPEPLPLGLDPTLDPQGQNGTTSEFQQKGTGLQAPAPLRWVHDLQAAEEVGLAVRIDLAQYPEFATGVDKIFVLGLKLSADSTEGGRLLNEHFENCLYKENGLAVLPQGTATNNFAGETTGFNQRAAEAGQYFRALWTPPAETDVDEARLREILGLPAAFHLPGGWQTDVREAVQMNRLLWPATIGHYLLQFFSPTLPEADRERTRQFFTNYVTGRGLWPVVRINRQPYGIIPTTSYAHWRYVGQTEEENFLNGLWRSFLSPLNAFWRTLIPGIMAAANDATAGQRLDETFLKMLGQSASSVQFKRQLLLGAAFGGALRSIQPSALTALGEDPNFRPAERVKELIGLGLDATLFKSLTDAFYSPRHRKSVRAATTDILPLSEHRGLQRLPEKNWNYLRWLAEAKLENIWTSNFSDAPAGDEPINGNAAAYTLFSRLSRQAVLRTYLEAGLRKTELNPGLWLLKAKNFEPEHLYTAAIPVNPKALVTTNKLHQLYRPIIEKFGIVQSFTLQPDRWKYLQPIADQLDKPGNDTNLATVKEMKNALATLSGLPTARLDRLFSEHVDLCSHRLDAWLAGLVSQRLAKQRKAKPTGIGLGAFGYLLNLKPSVPRAVVFKEVLPEYLPANNGNFPLAAIPIVHLDEANRRGITPDNNWNRTFFYIGDQANPGIRLNTATGQIEPEATINAAQSKGFLHAPSLAHAATSAILRAGHLSHQEDAQSEALVVKLNAPRTRTALQLIEGIQQGAALGELLGYRIERALHQRQLDGLIYELRKTYPLRRAEADNSATQSMTTTDGLAVITAFQQTAGIPLGLTDAAPAIREAADMLDAVGDLLLTESVFQTAQGNTNRAAAALRTLNSGGQVTPPEWPNTPQKGVLMHHRVGLVFDTLLANATGNVWTNEESPRTALAPTLNRWLARQLPAPETIAVVCILPDGSPQKLTLPQLGLEPIDLLHALPKSFEQAETSPLALLALCKAHKIFQVADMEQDLRNNNRPIGPLQVDFKQRSILTNQELTVFEVSAALVALRQLVAEARPLAPNDFLLPAAKAAQASLTKPDRLQKNLTSMATAALLQKTAVDLRIAATAWATAYQAGQTLAGRTNWLALHEVFFQAWRLGVADAANGNVADFDPENSLLIVEKAEITAQDLEKRHQKLVEGLAEMPADLSGEARFQHLEDLVKTVFDPTWKVFAAIELENATAVENALAGRQLLENASTAAVEIWLQEAALVRKALRSYRRTTLLREAFQTADVNQELQLVQIPFRSGQKQPWVGGPFDADTTPERLAFASLALETPANFTPQMAFTGLLLDEWPEFVPSKTIQTGVAFHYDQPNTQPPQAILLAVAPIEGGNWQWEHLLGAVKDALEMAQKRLVTLQEVENNHQGLSQVLPLIALPFTPENNQTPNVELF